MPPTSSTKLFVFDTETAALAPHPNGERPQFACMGWLCEDRFCWTSDFAAAREVVRHHLEVGDTVVGHNLAFDLDVLQLAPKVGQFVHDTMIADFLQRLEKTDCYEDAADGRFYSLEKLAGPIEGKGTVQLSFQPGHPPTVEQLHYLEQDVRATDRVARKQLDKVPGGLFEQMLQVRAGLALRQLERTGLNVDRGELEQQKLVQRQIQHKAAMVLKEAELYLPARKGPKGGEYKEKLEVKKFREHVQKLCVERSLDPELTDTGEISTEREFLLQLHDDPIVDAFTTYKDAQKIIGTFLGAWDSSHVHAAYRVMVRSGRTSCYRPNFQQIPSRAGRGEVKRVFVPPPGCEFYEVDYAQLELCTLAYWVRGNLLKAINNGVDVHRYLGSVYFQKPPDQVTKDERQLMKAANFGLPGGMGSRKFRAWVRSNGLADPGEAGARDLINSWLAAFPEMTAWLEDRCFVRRAYRDVWAGREEGYDQSVVDEAWQYAWDHLPKTRLPPPIYRALKDRKGCKQLEVWLTHRRVVVAGGRTRCPVSYTEERNTKFQGLASNLTKAALAALVLDNPGLCTVHAFIHDSVLVSVPQGTGPERMPQVAQVMLKPGDIWIPGVRLGVEICGPGSSWYEAKHSESVKIFNF